MPINKPNEIANILLMIRRMDDLCDEYQAASGDQKNERLFRWMQRLDGHYDRARQAHSALVAVLSPAQINALLDDTIDTQGVDVGASLIAIRNAVRAVQDVFAAQLGNGIDARERERVTVNQVRGWTDITNSAASRTPIDVEVADLRTALAPLVVITASEPPAL